MLKDSETARYATRRTHRTYTAEFKAELIAACKVPGASIAAVAGTHDMNANVLHRWLKEKAQPLRQELPSFIPVALPIAASQPVAQEIKVEVRRGALTMTVTWPMSAAGEFANWSASLLK